MSAETPEPAQDDPPRIRRGIRWKLLTSMIGLIVGLLAILTYVQILGQRQLLENALDRRVALMKESLKRRSALMKQSLDRRVALMKESLTRRGKTLAESLKRQAENDIAAFNLSNVAEVIGKAVREDEDLSHAILMDSDRMAHIHTLDAEQSGEPLDEKEDRFAAEKKEAGLNEYTKDGEQYVDFIEPIAVGTEQWGTLRLVFSLRLLNQEIVDSGRKLSQEIVESGRKLKQEIVDSGRQIDRQIRSMVIRSVVTSVAFIALGIGVVLWVSTRLSRPIWRLTASANELAKGDFSAADRIAIQSEDELGVLSHTFVQMSRQLKVSYDQLEDYSKTLEHKVDERTQELTQKNEQLEDTLGKLQEAQKQIIVQEKLASLGALTAGIAHEIKNPLNFVNNFAELSIDLVQEIREVLEEQKAKLDEETLDDLQDVLGDLEMNATKINEHGKRADSIVRSMLEHSRGTPGEKQTVDLNAVLDEYVNLAYHGMRAQDSSFNVTLETDYDSSIGEMEVVPQDISRAILNILNNACHAADEKARESDDGFSPTIWVRSKSLDDQVEIRIKDNGKGIPKHVQESIFEPFFTTKPTGKGTGLGLSITYDIIVQEHAGALRFETEEGEYTEFVINLPKDQS